MSFPNGTSYSNQSVQGTTFAAVTAAKFKVVLTNAGGATTPNAFAMGGVCLLHSAAPTAVAVPDITWGILVPLPTSPINYTTVYDVNTYYNNYNMGSWGAMGQAWLTNNPATGRNSYWYGKTSNNIPAIIDSCGQDSTSNKITITKSTGLMSTDQPLLSSYKYFAGDFI